MQAIVQDEYGTEPESVLRLAEIAKPTIGEDEVLVHVRAASVDRGTWHVMTGRPYLIRALGFGLRAPKAPNPGRSLAGTVESVGKNVTQFAPGDEVYGSCDGSFAEFLRGLCPALGHRISYVGRDRRTATWQQADKKSDDAALRNCPPRIAPILARRQDRN